VVQVQLIDQFDQGMLTKGAIRSQMNQLSASVQDIGSGLVRQGRKLGLLFTEDIDKVVNEYEL